VGTKYRAHPSTNFAPSDKPIEQWKGLVKEIREMLPGKDKKAD